MQRGVPLTGNVRRSCFLNFPWTHAAIPRPVLCCSMTGEQNMSNTLLREGNPVVPQTFINLAAAIRHGLRSYGVAGASVALGLAAAPVFAQDAAAQAADQKSQSLETIVVTG